MAQQEPNCLNNAIQMPAIPASMMEPCNAPEKREIKTNADVIKLLSDTIQAYDICSARHDALVHAITEQEKR